MKTSHIMPISKILIGLCTIRQKIITKKHFCRSYLQCFSSEKVLIEYKETSLGTNGKQSIKLKSGSMKFKNYLKQLAAPSKISADFESLLKWIKRNNGNKNTSYTEKYQDHILFSLAYNVVCIDDKFSKILVLCRGKNAVNKFIEAIHKDYDCCKKIIKKDFNKNFIISL